MGQLYSEKRSIFFKKKEKKINDEGYIVKNKNKIKDIQKSNPNVTLMQSGRHPLPSGR